MKWRVIIFLLYMSGAADAQSSGNAQLQIALTIAGLERALLANDASAALDMIDRLQREAPDLIGGDLHYFEARMAEATGDTRRADRALSAFLERAQRNSLYYQAALELRLDLDRAEKQRIEDRRLAQMARTELQKLEAEALQLRRAINALEDERSRNRDTVRRHSDALADDYKRRDRLCYSRANWISAAAQFGVGRILSRAHCESLFNERDKTFRASRRHDSLARARLRRTEDLISSQKRPLERTERMIAAKQAEIAILDP
jgi:septal ring factor EnvC (AmiA/AmiB activator)